MGRTVVAFLKVSEERAFAEIDDGPVTFVEQKAKALERSSITLVDATIADDDADDPKEAYLVYLLRYAFDNLGSAENVSPLTYEEWRKI